MVEFKYGGVVYVFTASEIVHNLPRALRVQALRRGRGLRRSRALGQRAQGLSSAAALRRDELLGGCPPASPASRVPS